MNILKKSIFQVASTFTAEKARNGRLQIVFRNSKCILYIDVELTFWHALFLLKEIYAVAKFCTIAKVMNSK